MVSVLAGSGQAEVGHCNESLPHESSAQLAHPCRVRAGSTFAAHTHQQSGLSDSEATRMPWGRRDPGGGGVGGASGSSWIMASSVTWGPRGRARLLTVCLETGVSPGLQSGAARPLVRGHMSDTHAPFFGLTHSDLVPKPPLCRCGNCGSENSLQGLDTG